MPKRTHHHPGVTPRGNSITIDFTWEGRRCRETLKLIPSPPNINYAVTLRRSIIDAITLGKFTIKDYEKHFPNSKRVKQDSQPMGCKRSLNKCLDEWFDSVRHTKKQSTIKSYNSIISIFQQEFADSLLISDLKITQIREIIKKWQEAHITKKTIRNRLIILRRMLDREVEQETIANNPINKIQAIETPAWEDIRNLRTIIDPFELNSVNTIIKAASDSIQNFIEVNFFTGLRLGEMYGLAYEDIDFKEGAVHICRARTAGHLCVPKTKSSIRTIELLPRALAALERQKEHTFMKPAIDCGDFGELHFVFYHPRKDVPWLYDRDFRRLYWIPLLRKAGVRYRYPYQMRHTFASLCLAAGEDLLWVAKQLGHVNTLMVTQHYGKWLPDTAAAAGRRGGDKIKALLR